jgi:hypothetical protein
MSNYQQPNGDDYPEAAQKHARDSQQLLAAGRFDGAGYLAGYAIECVLKTIALVEENPLRGHNLNNLRSEVITLLSVPSCKTAKYVSLSSITILKYGQSPGEWKETLRYMSEGKVTQANAQSWVAEAQRLCMEVISQMKLDGVIR